MRLEGLGGREMRARGLSYGEIARELQVSKASITSHVQYLREQAKESIKEYVTEHLPEQYQVCLSALDIILKHAFEMLETSQDNREKLQAMELFKDTHLVKLELLSNATVVDDAIRFVSSNKFKDNLRSTSDNDEVDKEESTNLITTKTKIN